MVGTNGGTADIPVIDISEANQDAAADLIDAAAKYGFLFVKNNTAGIAPGEIADVFSLVNLQVWNSFPIVLYSYSLCSPNSFSSRL